MLVSHSHRFVFLKTYKTAGTSLYAMLRPFCMPPQDRAEDTRAVHISPWGIVARGAMKGSELYVPHNWHEHRGLGLLRTFLPNEFHAYHKIAAVRHPYDKTVSAFFYGLWNQRQMKPNKPRAEDFSHAHLTRRFSKYVMPVPRSSAGQHDRKYFFCEGQFMVDSVIRYEHLHEDLQAMSERLNLGLDVRKELPLKKRVVEEELRQRYRQLITPEAKAAIDDYYGWYFEQFGYEKTL